MRLRSRGLGRKELVMDFREYTVERNGKEIVITGVIHEPVTWDFAISVCEDDLPGVARLIFKRSTLGMALRAMFRRNKDHHWSTDREAHLADVNERRSAAAGKDAAGKDAAEKGKTPERPSGKVRALVQVAPVADDAVEDIDEVDAPDGVAAPAPAASPPAPAPRPIPRATTAAATPTPRIAPVAPRPAVPARPAVAAGSGQGARAVLAQKFAASQAANTGTDETAAPNDAHLRAVEGGRDADDGTKGGEGRRQDGAAAAG